MNRFANSIIVISLTTFLYSSNCFARLQTIEFCSEIASPTEYIILAKAKSDNFARNGNRTRSRADSPKYWRQVN